MYLVRGRLLIIGQTPVTDGRHQSREHSKTVAEGKAGGFTPRNIHRDGGKTPPIQYNTI